MQSPTLVILTVLVSPQSAKSLSKTQVRPTPIASNADNEARQIGENAEG